MHWNDGETPVAIGNQNTTAHQAKFTVKAVDRSGQPVAGKQPQVKILSGGRGPTDGSDVGKAYIVWPNNVNTTNS